MPPPPLPPKDPDGRPAFLAEAKAIIAQAGGINPASLARLRAVAQKYGLSAAELNAAMNGLTGSRRKATATPAEPARAAPKAQGKPRSKAFARFAREVLGDHPGLPPDQYRDLLELGATDYGLDQPAGLRVLAAVCREAKVEFLPPDDPEPAVIDRARELDATGELDDDGRTRLRQAAELAGVEPTRFEELLVEAARPDPAAPTRGMPLSAALAMAAVVLFAVGGGIGYFVFLGGEPVPEGTPEVAVNPEPAPPPPPDPKAVDVKWGDAAVAEAIRQAAAVDGAPLELWRAAAAAEPPARAAAYKALVAQAVRPKGAGVEALAVCYAADPADEAARAIGDCLPDLLPGPKPVSADTVRGWVAGTDFVKRLLAAPNLPPARTDAVAKAVERATGTKPPPAGLDRPAQVVILLKMAIFGRLTQEAGKNPAAAVAVYTPLAAEVGDGLPPDGVARLERTFLVAVVGSQADQRPAAGAIRPLIAKAVATGKDAQLELVQAYENALDSDVRTTLEQVLLAATMAERGSDPKETAGNIRAALSGEGKRDPRQRLQQLARKLQGRRAPGSDRPVELLQDAVQFAHASALACALCAGPRANENRFDELAQAPPDVTPKAPPAAAPPMPPGAGMAPGVPGLPGGNPGMPPKRGFPPRKSPGTRPPGSPRPVPMDPVQQARMLSGGTQVDRLANFEALCTAGPNVLTPEIAKPVAYYLVRATLGKGELDDIKVNLAAFFGAHPLLVALADELAAGSPPKDRAESILTLVLPNAPALPDARWNEFARRALLRAAADPGADEAANMAAAKYRQFVVEQGQFLGMPATDLFLRAEPSAALEAVVLYAAKQVKTDRLAEADRRFLDQLPHQAAAYSFLGYTDLQKTVALQRPWVRVVGLLAVQRNRSSADAVSRVLAELRKDDQRSDDVLVQFRAGEARLLELWLLELDGKK